MLVSPLISIPNRVREVTEALNARADLEALCEWHAIERFKKEQVGIKIVRDRVEAHRCVGQEDQCGGCVFCS